MSRFVYMTGAELSRAVQRQALARFVYRYTRDHTPQCVRKTLARGQRNPVQFASDADWLTNTRFAVTKAGELDGRAHYCLSSPTWPDGTPEMPIAQAQRAEEVQHP